MSLPSDLCLGTVETIARRLALREVHGPDGGPMLRLTSAIAGGAEVGQARVFEGDALQSLVYVGLVVPQFGLDSHMAFAFTPATSPVPHFTLDSVSAGPTFAFHLDLIPRVDLGMHLPYMDAAFVPLTDVAQGVRGWQGLSPAQLSPRQLAIMSPWMLAYRADEKAFSRLGEPVHAYLDHWFGLLSAGLPAAAVEGTDPQALDRRDRVHRSILFNPDVDPVWGRVGQLLGIESAERVRSLLLRT